MADDERSSACAVTQEFIKEHADGDTQIQAVLETDAAHETWEFEDVDVDSGVFGEIVSRGIVKKVDGEYRLADHDGVHEAVYGETPEESTTKPADQSEVDAVRGVFAGESGRNVRSFVPSLRAVVLVRRGLVVLGLIFIGVMRTIFHYSDVYRDGTIVLVGNDPYRRRYWLEQLVESGLQPWNPLDLASLPDFVTTTDTFFYWATWSAAAMLGNSTSAVSIVLAWYPVVAATLTGLAVYAIALRVTGDVRVGVASVFMLAIIPIHASYTALGMGDHHALDYLLFILVIGLLIVIVDERETVRLAGSHLSATWVGVLGLGATLAGLNAAWPGAPLWFFGVGVYVTIQSALAYYRDRSPVPRGVPIVVGILIAAALTLLMRFGFGWLQPYRVVTPLLLAAGAGVAIAAGEAGYRLGVPRKTGLLFSIVIGIVVAAGTWVAVPAVSQAVRRFQEYLNETAAENITETVPLFSVELGVVVGPLSYIGGVFAIALPAMAWLTWVALRDDRPEWLVVTSFGWYLFGWTMIQVRFTAEFSPLIALFAGVGFVILLSKVDLISPLHIGGEQTPDTSAALDRPNDEDAIAPEWNVTRAVYVGGFFILISIFAFIFIPSFMADITVGDSTYETATWIDEYSDERGYEYPKNYVFTPWSQNRQYNYYVNGESDRYRFAQQNYEGFVSSEDPDDWYEQLSRRGLFVVTHDIGTELPPTSTQVTLHERLGSGGENAGGTSHYQAKYVTDDRDRVVFELVPGARLTGVGTPNTVETVELGVDIEGETFTYRRQVETNGYGDYGLTVPYPGEYEILSQERSVTEDDVYHGEPVGAYRSHWTLDEGSGERISDPVGGHTGTVEHAEWVAGVEGTALQFDGTGATAVEDPSAQGIANESFTVSFWLRGNLTAADTDFPTALYRDGDGIYGFWARGGDDFGLRVVDSTGEGVRAFGIEQTRFDEWTMITGVLDRERNEVRLYENKTLATTEDATALGRIDDAGQLTIGGRLRDQYAPVAIDDIRIYATALDEGSISELYDQLAGSDRAGPSAGG